MKRYKKLAENAARYEWYVLYGEVKRAVASSDHWIDAAKSVAESVGPDWNECLVFRAVRNRAVFTGLVQPD